MLIRIHARSRRAQGGGSRSRPAEHRISVDGGAWERFASDAAMMRRIREHEMTARQRVERVEFEHV